MPRKTTTTELQRAMSGAWTIHGYYFSIEGSMRSLESPLNIRDFARSLKSDFILFYFIFGNLGLGGADMHV
jgi:hypothetical protein